jgi:hypothetical protein
LGGAAGLEAALLKRLRRRANVDGAEDVLELLARAFPSDLWGNS